MRPPSNAGSRNTVCGGGKRYLQLTAERGGIFIKSKKLIPALVLALTLVCGITVGASAASGLQEIAAYLDAEG